MYCNVAEHRACSKDPVPKDDDGDWVCTECSKEVASQRHLADCEQCNELEYIFLDIEQKIELLKSMAPTQGAEDAGRSSTAKTMEAELAALRSSLEQYRAHLIRTKAQSFIKYDYMGYLGQDDTMWYSLADYWAKLNPAKSKVATCEGTQAGISCHGTTFYFKNPGLEMREAYLTKYDLPADYFDDFPDPDEQSFLCENFQVDWVPVWCCCRCCWRCFLLLSNAQLVCRVLSVLSGPEQRFKAGHLSHEVRVG